MQLIQRKEKGDWHLRVCVGGKDFKINLKTSNKHEANRLAVLEHERLRKDTSLEDAFSSLLGQLERLPSGEAKRKRKDYRARLNVARCDEMPRMSHLWAKWCALKSTKRKASHKDDVSRWKRWTEFLESEGCKDARLDQVDEELVASFVGKLDERDITRQSKRRIISLAKNVIERFKDEYRLAVNPFDNAAKHLSNDLTISTDGLPDKREPFSVEEISKMLMTLDPATVQGEFELPRIIAENRREYYAIVLLMIGTGLRLKDAVFLQNKQIKDAVLELAPFKTRYLGAKIVRVPFPAWVRDVIQQYCVEADNGCLFPGLRAEYEKSRQEVAKSLNLLLKKLGIKTTGKLAEGQSRAVAIKGWHSFRHTYDSMMQQVVSNPILVQKAMGHASLSQTFDYTHVNMSELANAAEALNPLVEFTTGGNKDARA